LESESARELVLYGLKGLCAYADHARILGKTDERVYAFLHEALSDLLVRKGAEDVGYLVGLALKVGEINLLTMELLDAANTVAYGHPVPTNVPLGTRAGKAILVSGHDLRDME